MNFFVQMRLGIQLSKKLDREEKHLRHVRKCPLRRCCPKSGQSDHVVGALAGIVDIGNGNLFFRDPVQYCTYVAPNGFVTVCESRLSARASQGTALHPPLPPRHGGTSIIHGFRSRSGKSALLKDVLLFKASISPADVTCCLREHLASCITELHCPSVLSPFRPAWWLFKRVDAFVLLV